MGRRENSESVSGTVHLTTAGSGFDTVLAVYRGNALPNLQFVASDDDGNGDQTSALYFSASIGREYEIAVETASHEERN